MLISKSRITCIGNNKIFNYSDLAKLCKNLILDDVVNFNVNKVGKGFPEGIAQVIANKVNGAKKDASILIFNNFSLILYDMLKEAGFTNIQICYIDFQEKDSKIVYNIMKDYISANFVEAEEILSNVISYEEVLNMNNKFDFIISNPPYAIGNAITKSIIDNVDFETFVNLMPASKYKGQSLYRHVSEVELAQDEFEDAAVGNSLTIAVLKPTDTGRFSTYDEFENEKRDPRYQEFYRVNAAKASCGQKLYATGKNAEDQLTNTFTAEDFLKITPATMYFGLRSNSRSSHSKASKIYTYNCVEPLTADNLAGLGGYLYQFASEIAKYNYIRFHFDNPLSADLGEGLCNDGGGTPKYFIPNIDWSVDRDYEHLTLEDIMNILREEA